MFTIATARNIRLARPLVVTLFLSVFLIALPTAGEAKTKPKRAKNPVMSVHVGDAKTKNKFTVNGAYVIETADGEEVMRLKKYQHASIKYTKKGNYVAQHGKKKVKSSEPLRVTPLYLHKKVEVTNFENRPSWNEELNDNVFFGSVEVVYSETSEKLLLVNHVPIERYVRGISEVTNDQNMQYLRTLLTASRTYALWHINHPTKHADEPYILTATEGDQLYRGANFSARAPRVVKAQKYTKRQVVQYKGEEIVAPYFSQSDGATKSWSDGFGGSRNYGWAQSVTDPCCIGLSLAGHGVGLSGEGARYFASRGWKWKKILKYYYTDVKIKKGY